MRRCLGAHEGVLVVLVQLLEIADAVITDLKIALQQGWGILVAEKEVVDFGALRRLERGYDGNNPQVREVVDGNAHGGGC